MQGLYKESRKGRMGSGRLTQTKERERDYTNEDLALLSHLKPPMNLWRALMSALDTEFKSSKNQGSLISIY